MKIEELILAVEDLGKAIERVEDGLKVRPSHLIVPPSLFKLARRIAFPHNILKRRKWARGRALTLKWRRK